MAEGGRLEELEALRAHYTSRLADKVIVDGRNLFEPETVESFGLQYYAIGRGRA